MPRVLLAALVAALLAACSTVPLTDRHQLLLVPESIEVDMGNDAWAQTLADAKIITSGPEAEMVQRVGRAVAEAAKRHPDFGERARSYEWEFVLIDAPDTVNAFALPGGKCAVYSGLLPVTQDEASLAVVLGHEVAHALARHGNERVSQSLIVNAGLNVAAVASGNLPPEDQELLMKALGVGAQAGFVLPFSRTHESEADHIGLFLCAEAGYDPRAAIGLWQRMASLGGERPPELLSTHPSEDTRIERLQAIMPKALKEYEKAKAAGVGG
jgi:predicted Zn-dependent protease